MNFFILLFFASCATTPLVFDPNLISSYHFDLEFQKPLPQPFYARYKKANKEVIFVAARHISAVEFPDLLAHPTLKTVDFLFRTFRPQVSIVEGIGNSNVLNPQGILSHADTCVKDKYQGNCGESIFTLNWARETKTDFISGEPDDTDILRQLKGMGFSEEDVLGLYVMRKIPQMKRNKTFNEKNLAKVLGGQILQYQVRLKTTEKFEYSDLVEWYQAHMTFPKDFRDVGPNDSAPHGGQDANYLQRISNKVNSVRDAHLLKTLERMLETHDRVLVVYGGSHYINLRPALDATFGSPEFAKAY